MNETYPITVTKKQLEVLSQAAEIIARLGSGQFHYALEWLPFKPDRYLEYDTIMIIANLISPFLMHNVNGWNSSLGIRSKEVREEAKIAWDLHQAFRKRLSWDRAVEQGIIASLDDPRKWPDMMGVNYDDPMIVSQEPLPSIVSL